MIKIKIFQVKLTKINQTVMIVNQKLNYQNLHHKINKLLLKNQYIYQEIKGKQWGRQRNKIFYHFKQDILKKNLKM